MIQFAPLVPWPFLFLILGMTLLSGGIPIFLNWESGVSAQKILIKTGLLLLFGLFLSLFLLQPSRKISSDKAVVLVYSEEVEQAEIQYWKDSLGITKTKAIADFQPDGSRVLLLGKGFSKENLYPIHDLNPRWILPEKNREISELSWKGFVRKGEKQRMNYRFFSEGDSAKLQVKQGETTLASTDLKKGWNEGELDFETAGLGRTEVPLLFDGDSLAVLRYFIGPATPKKYHFQFAFPGQEVRVLSQWLESKGEKVSQEIRLSRGTILEGGETSGDSLQIRLIDPSQLEVKTIQDWAKNSVGALVVMNLTEPLETISRVNRLFGTDFQLQRSGQGESRVLDNQLEAAPFSWLEKSGQKVFGMDAFAVQRVGEMQIAISLYQATFPLFLQGKEKEYESIWGEVFGELEPSDLQSWKVSAPVLSGISSDFQLNKRDSLPEWIYFGKDSVNLIRQLTNPFLAKGSVQIDSVGWMDFGEDLSVFVYSQEEFPSLHAQALIRPLTYNSDIESVENHQIYVKVTNWIWLIGLLLSLGLMWIEPKINY